MTSQVTGHYLSGGRQAVTTKTTTSGSLFFPSFYRLSSSVDCLLFRRRVHHPLIRLGGPEMYGKKNSRRHHWMEMNLDGDKWEQLLTAHVSINRAGRRVGGEEGGEEAPLRQPHSGVTANITYQINRMTKAHEGSRPTGWLKFSLFSPLTDRSEQHL